MPRKPPTKQRNGNITYLSPRGKMSSNPPAATGGNARTAPPSRRGTVYFERGSAIPRVEDLVVLRRHARRLLLNPQSRMLVRGYANRRSPGDGARKLARSRAAIVRMLLLTMGVSDRQIETEVGDVYQVTAATTRTSRATNRRAELRSNFWDAGVSLLPSLLVGKRRQPRARRRAA